MTDVIDALAGITAGSPLYELRRRKPVTRDNAQASFDALLEAETAEMSRAERAAVAYFVAGLHGEGIEFYRARLEAAEPALVPAVRAAIETGAGSGPYGRFPAGPLSAEDQQGPVLSLHEGPLVRRLAAALEHAHMLVFHPRDAAASNLRALEAAGWSATGIVTLSQLVSFLSFQLRTAAGLRVLDRSRG